MPRGILIIGGEASKWNWVSSLQSKAPECSIYNHYGPTETTVGVLMFHLRDAANNDDTVNTPLGTPLANTRIYVLDGNMGPAPIGVAGELYIGGLNVARGYLNRAELTAEKFLPDPFGDEGGGRLYRTGDRVRRRRDGNVEFLGRFDDQIKLRGFRIELNEVESVLMNHASVREAVAVIRERAGEEPRLVAYVVPQPPGRD